jgi:hypothetical protein
MVDRLSKLGLKVDKQVSAKVSKQYIEPVIEKRSKENKLHGDLTRLNWEQSNAPEKGSHEDVAKYVASQLGLDDTFNNDGLEILGGDRGESYSSDQIKQSIREGKARIFVDGADPSVLDKYPEFKEHLPSGNWGIHGRSGVFNGKPFKTEDNPNHIISFGEWSLLSHSNDPLHKTNIHLLQSKKNLSDGVYKLSEEEQKVLESLETKPTENEQEKVDKDEVIEIIDSGKDSVSKFLASKLKEGHAMTLSDFVVRKGDTVSPLTSAQMRRAKNYFKLHSAKGDL